MGDLNDAVTSVKSAHQTLGFIRQSYSMLLSVNLEILLEEAHVIMNAAATAKSAPQSTVRCVPTGLYVKAESDAEQVVQCIVCYGIPELV